MTAWLSEKTARPWIRFRSWRTVPGHEVEPKSAIDFGARRRRPGLLLAEVLDQRGDILDALVEARHRDRQDVQPVEEVLAEQVGDHPPFQRGVRRRDDPTAELPDRRRPDGHEPAGLEDAKQLRLQRQRQLRDLVQEQRSVAHQRQRTLLPAGRRP